MQTAIKFKRYGANSAFGGFAPGDRMRCDAALARHLVEELDVADYEQASAPTPAAEPTGPAPKRRKRAE